MKTFRIEGDYIESDGERVGLAKIVEADCRLQLAMDCFDKYKDLKHLTVTEVEPL